MERFQREEIEGHRVTFRHRAGRWQYDLALGGRRHRRNGGATLAEARRAARALVQAGSAARPTARIHHPQPRPARGSGPTLRECTAFYLRKVQEAGRVHSERTARRMVALVLGELGERTRADTLTPERVEEFLASRRSPHERAKAARYLKAILNDAVRRGRIAALPCPIRVPKARRMYRPALAPDQVSALLEAAGWRTYPLLLLAVTTGARHRELTSRMWRDYDPKRSLLTVAPQPQADFDVKTEDSARQLRLPPFACEALAMYHDELETAAGEELRPSDWIFPHTPGSARPWEQSRVCKAVREVFEDAGLGDIPGAGLHCLRRTWATVALDMGHSVAVVQSEGGWASPQVLLDCYARPTQDQRARLAEGVSDALGLKRR